MVSSNSQNLSLYRILRDKICLGIFCINGVVYSVLLLAAFAGLQAPLLHSANHAGLPQTIFLNPCFAITQGVRHLIDNVTRQAGDAMKIMTSTRGGKSRVHRRCAISGKKSSGCVIICNTGNSSFSARSGIACLPFQLNNFVSTVRAFIFSSSVIQYSTILIPRNRS